MIKLSYPHLFKKLDEHQKDFLHKELAMQRETDVIPMMIELDLKETEYQHFLILPHGRGPQFIAVHCRYIKGALKDVDGKSVPWMFILGTRKFVDEYELEFYMLLNEMDNPDSKEVALFN